MSAVRVAAAFAALALLLAGCGSSSPPPHPTIKTSCTNAGSVAPSNPVVQLKTSQGLHSISRSTIVGCADWVKILGTSAVATMAFGPKASCQLSQIGPGQTSLVQIRDPESVLFTLEPGEVLCTFFQPQNIPMCGNGTVYPNGYSAGLIACGDPLFKVHVDFGTMRVKIRNQACLLTAGALFTFNFKTGKPGLTKLGFGKAQAQVLARQAEELGMAVQPRTSSTPSTCATT